jgi:hypothetical protein
MRDKTAIDSSLLPLAEEGKSRQTSRYSTSFPGQPCRRREKGDIVEGMDL